MGCVGEQEPKQPSLQLRAVGLLVCYSEAYAERSLRELRRLLNAVSVENYIVLVDNSPASVFSQLAGDRTVVIGGDNRVQEFSAWDRGIAYSADVLRLDGSCIVVVANDTFCNHHRFGRLDVLFLSKIFRHYLRRSARAVVGEVNFAVAPMEVLGLPLDRWIPTYLFALRWDALRALAPMALSETELARAVRRTTVETDFFGEINSAVRERLVAWLFRPGNKSWYKAGRLNELSVNMYYNKARTIICEKHFAARAASADYLFVDTFSQCYHLYFFLFKARAAVAKIGRLIRSILCR